MAKLASNLSDDPSPSTPRLFDETEATSMATEDEFQPIFTNDIEFKQFINLRSCRNSIDKALSGPLQHCQEEQLRKHVVEIVGLCLFARKEEVIPVCAYDSTPVFGPLAEYLDDNPAAFFYSLEIRGVTLLRTPDAKLINFLAKHCGTIAISFVDVDHLNMAVLCSEKIHGIKRLEIKGCSLSYFPPVYNFRDLKRLDLSYNKLTNLHLSGDAWTTEAFSSLEALNLHSNPLEGMDLDSFKYFPDNLNLYFTLWGSISLSELKRLYSAFRAGLTTQPAPALDMDPRGELQLDSTESAQFKVFIGDERVQNIVRSLILDAVQNKRLQQRVEHFLALSFFSLTQKDKALDLEAIGERVIESWQRDHTLTFHNVAFTSPPSKRLLGCLRRRFGITSLAFHNVRNLDMWVFESIPFERLVLSNCGLTTFPRVEARELKELDLSHNRISCLSRINKNASGFECLYSLNLTGNPVEAIEPGFFKTFQNGWVSVDFEGGVFKVRFNSNVGVLEAFSKLFLAGPPCEASPAFPTAS